MSTSGTCKGGYVNIHSALRPAWIARLKQVSVKKVAAQARSSVVHIGDPFPEGYTVGDIWG